MNLIKKLFSKIFTRNNVPLNTINIVLGVLSNIKLFKLRLSRPSVKISTINMSNFAKMLKKNDKQNCILNAKDFDSKNDLITESSKILRRYGALIVKNCFSNEEISNFLEINKDIDPKIKLSNDQREKNYINKNTKQIPLNRNPFLLDDRIIKTIETSCNSEFFENEFYEKIYVRQPSTYAYFKANEQNTKKNWIGGWHVDFPTQITTHIILEDLSEQSIRMQILPMTKNLPLIPGVHYKLDKGNIDFEKHFVDCIGPKGTLYVHTGNTLHRNYPVYNTERFVWSQIYTMDKVFVLISKKDKNELLDNCSEYINSLDKNQLNRINVILQSTESIENQKFSYCKMVNEKYLPANKQDLTYL